MRMFDGLRSLIPSLPTGPVRERIGVTDRLSVRGIEGDMSRIHRAKRLLADHGFAELNHFLMISGKLTARRIPWRRVLLVAQEFGVSTAEVMALPHLKAMCYDEERVAVDNLVVDVGHEFIVDAFQGSVEPEAMNFHAVGTGVTAAAAGDTTLETENLLGNANRPAGAQGENGAKVYQTVATITKTDAVGDPLAVTEAGILSLNAVGVLLSRQVFAAINLSQNDAIETTWEYTIS